MHSIINVCLLGQIHIERGLPVEHIISRIYELIKETKSLIEFEEQLQLLMHSTFAELVGDVFTNLNQVIKEQKQEEKWKVERNDQNNTRYPLDEWLGIRKRQKQSPLVEIKVAESASESDYREVERTLKEWTAVDISHSTVGAIVRRVGKAQAEADEAMVQELEES